MKINIIVLFTLSALSVGCADKADVQKYQAMRLETAKLISQCDTVIKNQEKKIDSINKLINKYILREIKINDYNWEIEVNTALDVKQNMAMLQTWLRSFAFNCSILERANTRFGYLFKGKKSIESMYTLRLNDSYRVINGISGGLTAKEYIYKYLP